MKILFNVYLCSQSSYFIFVTHDRHFGDICHVFECVDQSARSLAAALHDVIVTSRSANERKRSPGNEEKQKKIANSGNAIEKVVDDDNNNNVIISMY